MTYNSPTTTSDPASGEGEPTENVPGGGAPVTPPPAGDGSHGGDSPSGFEQQKGQDHQGGSASDRSGAGGGGPLSPLGKKCDGEGDEPDRSPGQYWRRRRYRRREALWQVTDLQRCAYCGRIPYSKEEGVTVYREDSSGGDVKGRIEGVQTCGSVSLCPACAWEPRRRRAGLINEAVASHREDGGQVLEGLLTLKHGTEHGLAEQMEAMKAGWAAVMQASGSWGARKLKEKMGHVGHTWATEVTWNPEHGWHLHRHVLFFVEEPLSPEEIEGIEERMYHLYKDAVQEAGMPCPSRAFNRIKPLSEVDREMDPGLYLTKADSGCKSRTGSRVGEEVARGDEKTAQKGLMPFEILDRIAEAREMLDHFRSELEKIRERGGTEKWKKLRVEKVRGALERWESLWLEYEEVVDGETMMNHSKDFEDRFADDDDGDDDAGSGGGEEKEEVGTIDAHIYKHLASLRGGVATLLEVVEGDGRIRQDGNRIAALGEGREVDFEEFIEAVRLDWWLREASEPAGRTGPVESNV